MSVSSSTMRPAVLHFLAGFCGALGFALLLLSLSTDYWLLATEACDSQGQIPAKLPRVITEDGLREESGGPKLLSYHEGIFWRCTYLKNLDREEDSMLDFWITNQASEKKCVPSYLSDVPLSEQTKHILSPVSTTVHRVYWCLLSMLGLTLVIIAVFLIVCGIPTASRRLYKAGGAFFITGGLVQLTVVVLFAVWVQGSSSLERYALQRRFSTCASLHLFVHYGPSVLLAPVASFFSVLCGLLLLRVRPQRRVGVCHAHEEPPTAQDRRGTSTL
ncbi:transmembrane protein 182 [Electrophorus electricus]|uniref:transmembrane protein 182 n=1 Tax=Electrophorus electricus TaxID=8005 RepID=UPI0015CFA617|nr:transmembrane protein 182 [Electrophorus electricus]